MIKKILPFFIAFALIVGFPMAEVSAATTVKTATTTKTVVKKKTTKKRRSTKRKEKLTVNPPLITLDTAPHSGRPLARAMKRKTTKKSTSTKKKV